MSLLREIEALSAKQIFVSVLDKSYSTKTIVEIANNFRAKNPSLEGASVAVSYSNLVDFITTIAALDGWSRDIFLSPPTLDEKIADKLRSQINCSWLLAQSGIAKLSAQTKKEPFDATRWWLATSGTTDTPKLFGHTLESLTKTVKSKPLVNPLCWGLVYDFNRFAGLQVVLQSLLSGSKLVSAENLSHDTRAKTLLAEEVTAISATPSLWRALLMEKETASLKLRQITIGGEIVDQSLLNVLAKYFPHARIVHIYASTEAGVGFSVKDKLAGFPASWLNRSNGPVPIKIDSNNHLCIQPVFSALGNAFQERLDSEGYFDTQDVVQIENERVFFLGRASGAINVGGNKVLPEEIEQIILEISGIKSARVSGKSSSILGQLVVAEVVTETGIDKEKLKKDIIRRCQEKLERFKVPSSIAFVDTLSATSTGKLERK